MSACAIDAHIYYLEAVVVLLLHPRHRRWHLHQIFGNDAHTTYNLQCLVGFVFTLSLCAYLSSIESNAPIAKAQQTVANNGQR